MATPRIFVSHSSHDDNFGTRLVQDLRSALGSDDAVWYDSQGGLHGGDSWWAKIVREVTTCDVFLIVLSPEAMASYWVLRELDMAIIQRKPIIPLLYRPCEVRADLLTIQMIRFLPPKPYKTSFAELLVALGLPKGTEVKKAPTQVSLPQKASSPALSPSESALLSAASTTNAAVSALRPEPLRKDRSFPTAKSDEGVPKLGLPRPERRGRSWILLLLLVPFIVLLYPPFYNFDQPEFIGIPFFYWFQLLWIIITAILTAVLYVLRA